VRMGHVFASVPSTKSARVGNGFTGSSGWCLAGEAV
jgi:hypothetical protein